MDAPPPTCRYAVFAPILRDLGSFFSGRGHEGLTADLYTPRGTDLEGLGRVSQGLDPYDLGVKRPDSSERAFDRSGVLHSTRSPPARG